uniref:KfbT n=1 Tax=Primula veris TaxID=170927 RepID=A0A3Q8GY85_PRIVE|nr:KfbT [Primula veris]
MEVIPGLPEDLGLECLIRSHYTTFRVVSQTCHLWRKLLQTTDFHSYRKKKGYSHKMICFVQSIPPNALADETGKSANSCGYGITVFDLRSRTWGRLSQVPKYQSGLPLFCRVASSGNKLIVMGGWDPFSYHPVKDVFVYDFVNQLWRQGKDMPSKRSFFAMGAIDGHVYVAGGHDENKGALKSAWVYDLGRDEWTEMIQMAHERDECEGIVMGNEFWVVSGYDTSSQGVFVTSAESYCVSTRMWNLVESVWKAGQCPRSSVLSLKPSQLISYTEFSSAITDGAFGIALGGQILLKESADVDVKKAFFLVDVGEGQNYRIEKINVPDQFSGLVQSGCSVEI